MYLVIPLFNFLSRFMYTWIFVNKKQLGTDSKIIDSQSYVDNHDLTFCNVLIARNPPVKIISFLIV